MKINFYRVKKLLNSQRVKKFTETPFGMIFCFFLFYSPVIYIIKGKRFNIKNPIYCIGKIGAVEGKGFATVRYSFAKKNYTRTGKFITHSYRSVKIKWILLAVDSANPKRANILYGYDVKPNIVSNSDTVFFSIPYELLIDSTLQTK